MESVTGEEEGGRVGRKTRQEGVLDFWEGIVVIPPLFELAVPLSWSQQITITRPLCSFSVLSTSPSHSIEGVCSSDDHSMSRVQELILLRLASSRRESMGMEISRVRTCVLAEGGTRFPP